jgi:hypothetical protein
MPDIIAKIRNAAAAHQVHRGRPPAFITLNSIAWRMMIAEYLNGRGGSHDGTRWSVNGVPVEEAVAQTAEFLLHDSQPD